MRSPILVSVLASERGRGRRDKCADQHRYAGKDRQIRAGLSDRVRISLGRPCRHFVDSLLGIGL